MGRARQAQSGAETTNRHWETVREAFDAVLVIAPYALSYSKCFQERQKKVKQCEEACLEWSSGLQGDYTKRLKTQRSRIDSVWGRVRKGAAQKQTQTAFQQTQRGMDNYPIWPQGGAIVIWCLVAG